MRPGSARRDGFDTRARRLFVDTDGDEASSVGGTFVIEDSGWTSLPAGARKEFGEDFVSLLVVQVDQVWSPVCGGGEPLAAGSTAEALANQVAAAGFTIREALAPVTAFGHDGHHLAIETPGASATRVPYGKDPHSGASTRHLVRSWITGSSMWRGLRSWSKRPRSPTPRWRTWPSSERCSTPW